MNINHLIKELKNGNNPKENLQIYGQLLMNSFKKIALGDFALALTESFDYICEEKEGLIFEGRLLIEDITHYVCNCQKIDNKEYILQIDSFRNRLISHLKQLERYLHYFGIYEHIYNRAEYKFDFEPVEQDIDSFLLDVMNYIASAKDSQTQNERIQNILGEVPLKLTGLKFEDYVIKACKCYIGARSDITNDFYVQMFEASKAPVAMELSDQWSKMYELAKELENTSLDTISKEELKELSDRLLLAAQDLAKYLSNGSDLLNIINKLYLLLIVIPYAQNSKESQKVFHMIDSYLNSIKTGDFFDIDEDILGGLEKILEDQQKYLGEHMFMQDSLSEIIENNKDALHNYAYEELYNELIKAQKLCGGYPFSDINDFSNVFITDIDYINKKTDDLLNAYRDSFKITNRKVRKALMNKAFETMPVPFDTLEQIQSFIYSSLTSAAGYEESAGVHMIKNLMNNF